MLLTVREFRERVSTGIDAVVEELSELTGRGGPSERHAWRNSLPKLVEALTHPSFDRVHVHFSRRQHHVALEYQLPGSSSWCDVVLLGRHADRPSAVVIEMKDWDTRTDRPGAAEGLIERRGAQELHPSDQVRGYVDYCRRFHSAVLQREAQVHGLVLLTTGLLKHPYLVAPNDRLTQQFPVFSMAEEDVGESLPAFVGERLSQSDEVFATEFASGTFEQDRGFMRQIGRTVLDGDIRQFELLDNQRRAFNLCLATVEAALTGTAPGKKVVIVEGPPGSGKSAIAARLWASLVTSEELPEGNVVLVTTSQSQSSNWTYLIDQTARAKVGRGVARKATSFTPMGIPELSKLRKKTGQKALYKDARQWRSHLADLADRGLAPRAGAEDDSCLVSLVDEAHALIDPEREHGVGQHGFVTGLGPQAFHIIRCSRTTIFFLDPEQSFRSKENTQLCDIEAWAKDLGASVDRVSLHGVQFRCAGSVEYVSWIESLLSGGSEGHNRIYASAWHATSIAPTQRSGNVIAFPLRTAQSEASTVLVAAEGTGGYAVGPSRPRGAGMDFRVFMDPFDMESALRQVGNEHAVRLVSTYSRAWKTHESPFPHRIAPSGLDFHEKVETGSGKVRMWSRPWNFVPGGTDYTAFIAGRPGTPMHDDPLCEVGCTYAVRGFDFDYLGLLWLDDLLWRDGKWVVPLANVHESGIGTLVRRARKEGSLAPAGPAGVNVVEQVRRAYRILLTRAIRGIFVWIPDNETREHVARSLD